MLLNAVIIAAISQKLRMWLGNNIIATMIFRQFSNGLLLVGEFPCLVSNDGIHHYANTVFIFRLNWPCLFRSTRTTNTSSLICTNHINRPELINYMGSFLRVEWMQPRRTFSLLFMSPKSDEAISTTIHSLHFTKQPLWHTRLISSKPACSCFSSVFTLGHV